MPRAPEAGAGRPRGPGVPPAARAGAPGTGLGATEAAVQPDQLHPFVRVWPTTPPNEVAPACEGCTSHDLRRDSPWSKRLPNRRSHCLFAATAGAVSGATIRRDVEAQEGVERMETRTTFAYRAYPSKAQEARLTPRRSSASPCVAVALHPAGAHAGGPRRARGARPRPAGRARPPASASALLAGSTPPASAPPGSPTPPTGAPAPPGPDVAGALPALPDRPRGDGGRAVVGLRPGRPVARACRPLGARGGVGRQRTSSARRPPDVAWRHPIGPERSAPTARPTVVGVDSSARGRPWSGRPGGGG